MKQTLLTFAAAALLLASCGQKAPKLETQMDTISWVMGQSIATSALQSGINFDKEVVMKAIETTLNGGEQPLKQEEFEQILSYLLGMSTMEARSRTETQVQAAQAAQKIYFEELTKSNKELKTSPSGLLYEVLKPGKGGATCKEGDVAKFHYRAYSAIDGKLYDQTYGNRDAIIHVVGSPMMPALIEALTMMHAGEVCRFYFPLEVMAGMEGAPQMVPVYYEIELLEFNNKGFRTK